jgi:hypothetical protein
MILSLPSPMNCERHSYRSKLGFITLKTNGNDNMDLLQEGLDIIELESNRQAQMVDELLDFKKDNKSIF